MTFKRECPYCEKEVESVPNLELSFLTPYPHKNTLGILTNCPICKWPEYVHITQAQFTEFFPEEVKHATA